MKPTAENSIHLQHEGSRATLALYRRSVECTTFHRTWTSVLLTAPTRILYRTNRRYKPIRATHGWDTRSNAYRYKQPNPIREVSQMNGKLQRILPEKSVPFGPSLNTSSDHHGSETLQTLLQS